MTDRAAHFSPNLHGDIFLGWGEVGIRAYKNYNPSIPVKYIRNVLKQYEKDGLAYQRYDRKKGLGQGSDILSNNALPVVGLYRNIYGIQPKYNRLYIDPHLTEELNGTIVKYWLRDQYYTLQLSLGNYTLSANSFSVSSSEDFGMHIKNNELIYFNKENSTADMKISRSKHSAISLRIGPWNKDSTEVRKWSTKAPVNSLKLNYEILLLRPHSTYSLFKNDKPFLKVKSDSHEKIIFTSNMNINKEDMLELKLLDTD